MSLLRDRRFALLIVGQAVNEIGSWCALVALWGYSAFRFHASPFEIALVGVTISFPGALLGPLAGVPTDRYGPRRVIVVADSIAACVALLMAFADSYWQLLVPSFVLGTVSALTRPAWSALPPRLVEDQELQSANALLGMSQQSAIAFGPILGAVTISVWGARGAFVADAATYAVGVLVTLPLVVRRVDSLSHARMRDELREGVETVRARPALIRLLALACGVYALWGAFIALEPIFVRDVLHRAPATFAWLQSAFGLMMFSFGLLVARVGDRAARRETVVLAAIGSGVASIVYLGTGSVVIAFAGIMAWGAVTAWFGPTVATLIQRATPTDVHGRVFALDGTIRAWAFTLATLGAGALATATSVRTAAVTFGMLPVIAALVFWSAVLRERGPLLEQTPAEDAGLVAVVPADQ